MTQGFHGRVSGSGKDVARELRVGEGPRSAEPLNPSGVTVERESGWDGETYRLSGRERGCSRRETGRRERMLYRPPSKCSLLGHRLVPLGCAEVARGSHDFLDVTPFGSLFGSVRRAWRRFLDECRQVNVADAFLRHFWSAKLRACSQPQHGHKLVDVLFRRERSQSSIHVLTAYAALSFSRKVIFETFCNLFDFFDGQRMDGYQRLDMVHFAPLVEPTDFLYSRERLVNSQLNDLFTAG